MSGGHLCEAEAPTEAIAENSAPSRKVSSQYAGGDGTPPLRNVIRRFIYEGDRNCTPYRGLCYNRTKVKKTHKHYGFH